MQLQQGGKSLAAEVTYLISSSPEARSAVGIGFLVVALIAGGLIAAETYAQATQSQEPPHELPLAIPPSPSITRQHAETTALNYIFDASLDLAEHMAASALPPTPVTEPMPSLVTHYGEAYNGNVLGCGTGLYSSDNPTIVAVGPERDGEIPCGTLLHICGGGGCIVAQRQDACPGCAPILFDLSESAFSAVCGVPTGVCEATVSVLEACGSLDLAWKDRPEPPQPPARQRTVLDDLAEGALLALHPERFDIPSVPELIGEDTGFSPRWECAVR